MVFGKDDYLYASFEKVYDAGPGGKVWLNAQAHADLVAKTPYAIVANEYGPITGALPASGKYIFVGVPERAWTSGDIAKLQIGGYIEDMITASLSVSVGHGLTIASGAVADIGADFSGAAGEFFIVLTATTTSTTHTGILVPERIITI
jgi:hypothetical protein